MMQTVAVRDMQKLLPMTQSDAVKKRVQSFIARNQRTTTPPGPRFA